MFCRAIFNFLFLLHLWVKERNLYSLLVVSSLFMLIHLFKENYVITNDKPQFGNLVDNISKPYNDEVDNVTEENIPENIMITPPDLKDIFLKQFGNTSSQNFSSLPETLGTKKHILLLAYARSGSSFTGDLLSAHPNAAYYFEPFYLLRPGGHSIERALQENPSTVWQVRDYIYGIFYCNPSLLKKLSFHVIRTHGHDTDCINANPKVMKTIRIHKIGLEPWIYSTNIQVVHLVRDPRGMITSMASHQNTWGEAAKNYSQLCNKIQDDLSLEEGLGPNRYMRLRYEDLVEDTENELKRIYKLLDIPFTEQVRDAVFRHTNPSNKTRGGYYSTFRGTGFRTDSWKRKLRIEQIRMIEEECSSVLEKLNYNIFDPESEINI
ncbi:carbohydrate sulfotransferase 1 isoform X2 [Eurytemora carolleeae]|uniref:carbohydrate sulfotransferase 1 isoform X2 n=1 Tax=Eurytemora carolleeae TaxID=1294199 RepID=UPI000C777181|nr:carbohydrate sulfotransferase 1 isoform X2 [Eurytemora carolleeae]|eukprot:XP_023327796.1 carbohydrate sulfotransferase 1-like isoform X2 [Eurytemora affinis]